MARFPDSSARRACWLKSAKSSSLRLEAVERMRRIVMER
jgi:hypothetical protein